MEAPAIEDEEAQLTAYDHLERLDRFIPRMEGELDEEIEQAWVVINPALFLRAL